MVEGSGEEEAKAGKQPLVLLLRPLLPAFEQALAQKFRCLKPWESNSPPHLFFAAHADSIRAVLCPGPAPVRADIIRQLPRLECVVTASAGFDHIDLDACKQRGISVANVGDVCSEDAADYAVGLLLDVLRRISASDRYVRQGLWSVRGEYPLGSKLGGKRVGIVGLGSIGSAVAKRLEPFGCTISYSSRREKQSVPFPYFSSVVELAATSDVLVLSCALTDETFHIIDKNVLSALGKKGVIINVGRGALIDEKELVRCLVEGEIGGAGLDVYENEPKVPEELFTLDNVVLSRHSAAMTWESFSGLIEVSIANLEAFFSNKPLLTPLEA